MIQKEDPFSELKRIFKHEKTSLTKEKQVLEEALKHTRQENLCLKQELTKMEQRYEDMFKSYMTLKEKTHLNMISEIAKQMFPTSLDNHQKVIQEIKDLIIDNFNFFVV